MLKMLSIYNKICLILHALEEKFYVGIDRVSDYTVQNIDKHSKGN